MPLGQLPAGTAKITKYLGQNWTPNVHSNPHPPECTTVVTARWPFLLQYYSVRQSPLHRLSANRLTLQGPVVLTYTTSNSYTLSTRCTCVFCMTLTLNTHPPPTPLQDPPRFLLKTGTESFILKLFDNKELHIHVWSSCLLIFRVDSSGSQSTWSHDKIFFHKQKYHKLSQFGLGVGEDATWQRLIFLSSK